MEGERGGWGGGGVGGGGGGVLGRGEGARDKGEEVGAEELETLFLYLHGRTHPGRVLPGGSPEAWFC